MHSISRLYEIAINNAIIYTYNLDNGNQMVYNNRHNIIKEKCKMTRLELIKIICKKTILVFQSLQEKSDKHRRILAKKY